MLKGFITSLTLAVFAAFPVYAQEGISVGNPGSANTLIIRQGYAISTSDPVPLYPPQTQQTRPYDAESNQMQPSYTQDQLIIDNVTETYTPAEIQTNVDGQQVRY